jgi:hypothetical protein
LPVAPAQPETAFVKQTGVDLGLVPSEQHTRVVEKDDTLSFETLRPQLPSTSQRAHFVRCEVTVHRLPSGELAVTYLGRALGRTPPLDVLGSPSARHGASRRPRG